MIRLIVCGAGGRMGKRIVACALQEKGFEIVGANEKVRHPDIERDAGEAAGEKRIGVAITASLDSIIKKGDLVVDFSAPSALNAHVFRSVRYKKPLVVGTTGLDPDQIRIIENAAKKIPVVFSPNMSVGVNLLFDLVKKAAASLGEGYDVEIVEAHHRFKADAPSGTAQKLAQVIAEEQGRNLIQAAVYGRQGQVGERKRGEIGIHAVRAGDIVGEHTVIFSTLGERIELVHRAHSRDTFARGALRAAKFVLAARPGLYTMRDVLRERKTNSIEHGA